MILIRCDGTLPAVTSKSSRTGREFDGCFSYRIAYKATKRSLFSAGTDGSWMILCSDCGSR